MSANSRFESDPNYILGAASSELGLKINNIAPLNDEDLGDNSEVYTAESGERRIIIKLLPDYTQFQLEKAAFDLLSQHNIPCPTVLGILPANVQHKAAIIETAILGKPISHMEDNLAMYEAAGVTLKNIHAIKLDGFGSLEITTNGLRGRLASWKENAEKFKIDFASLQERGFIDSQGRAKLEHAHEVTANTELPQASFMHSDYSPQHVFSDGEKITGIIDMGTCYAGNPHKDITNMQYFLNPQQLAAFNSGYGPMTTDELIPYFALLAAANKVAYRADRGFADRLPEAIAALNQSLTIVE